MTDNWKTPKRFYDRLNEEFHFDGPDPCELNPEGLRALDGKSNEWPGHTIFVNPLYSTPSDWLIKAREQSGYGKTIVMLLRCDTSTVRFHELVFPHAEIRFIRGRLKFDDGSGKFSPAPFPSILAIYRPKVMRA
jgi:site-specific DNA-methyltransferase (adenine-specific)